MSFSFRKILEKKTDLICLQNFNYDKELLDSQEKINFTIRRYFCRYLQNS